MRLQSSLFCQKMWGNIMSSSEHVTVKSLSRTLGMGKKTMQESRRSGFKDILEIMWAHLEKLATRSACGDNGILHVWTALVVNRRRCGMAIPLPAMTTTTPCCPGTKSPNKKGPQRNHMGQQKLCISNCLWQQKSSKAHLEPQRTWWHVASTQMIVKDWAKSVLQLYGYHVSFPEEKLTLC